MQVNWIQRTWDSEQRMFAIATVLIAGSGGMFVLAPLVAFAVLMTGAVAQIAVVSAITFGCVAWGRALILQRRRYFTKSNE